MELRSLGKTDIRVSVVGIGCNNFGWRADVDETRAIVDEALESGINFFDTALSYGTSEEIMGEVLAGRREKVVIATKFGSPSEPADDVKKGSRIYIMRAVEASLRRLRTDYIDLYQLHYPDAETPIEETLRAMQDLLDQGKVRAIGCSNLSVEQLEEAQRQAQQSGLTPFATTQNEYSLLMRGIEQTLAPVIERYGMGLLPYFPLANGVLTGKYKPGQPVPADARLADAPAFFDPYRDPAKWEMAARLEQFAASRGHSLLELAFSWLASRPGVSSVIAGASKATQVKSNAQAAGWALTAEDMAEIDRITRPLTA